MTPRAEDVSNGVFYLGLGVEDDKFLAPHYWFLPSICYLDYDHEQRLFLKSLKCETRCIVFVSTFQCITHNILKRAKYGGKSIIKAAWRTCRFNSCVGSVYRNNPEPSAVERDIWRRGLKLQLPGPWRQ